ncbi:MAG TPA: endonuclease/exonuclease/phosphatase family protein, partial [Pyrinomonadaceae bacterium]|nr:endonuclease/exonuclease/phosphatase family protein [Pyrinomonadaceae bacterium]
MSYAIEQEREAEASPLEHELTPYFPALAEFSSTKTLAASPLYRKLRPEIERVLGHVASADFAGGAGGAHGVASSTVRATAWNIERGKRLESIKRVLKDHTVLRASDVLLLTELDYGMARTGNADVAREIAETLRMNYAFAPCYLALNKGSGVEADVEGENTHALHGNALLSRYPLRRAHAVTLPNGKDKMRGKEKRLGNQRAVVADVEHPAGMFRAVSLHLDAHSTQRHRWRQMRLVLDHLDRLEPRLPVVIGGDWNTSTYNARRAAYSILGYVRRVAMGVGNVVRNHYPYPERWFERKLFGELERRGYDYRELNALGVCTLHYDVTNMAANVNMGDWIPQWC